MDDSDSDAINLETVSWLIALGGDHELYNVVRFFSPCNLSPAFTKEFQDKVNSCLQNLKCVDAAEFVVMTADDVKCVEGYAMPIEGDDEPPEVWGQGDDLAIKGEVVYTHPGDAEPSEGGEPVNVVTKAAMNLYALKFFSHSSEEGTTMRLSYPCQFMSRVDSTHQRLYIDCLDSQLRMHVVRAPLVKDFKAGAIVLCSDFRCSPDPENKFLLKVPEADFKRVTFIADIGRLTSGTCFRLSIPLEDISGIRYIETPDRFVEDSRLLDSAVEIIPLQAVQLFCSKTYRYAR
jgi:hypothetical protein